MSVCVCVCMCVCVCVCVCESLHDGIQSLINADCVPLPVLLVALELLTKAPNISFVFILLQFPSCYVHVGDKHYPYEQPDCFSSTHEIAQPDSAGVTKKGRTFGEIREENRSKKQSKMQSQSSSFHPKKQKESKTMKGQQKVK